jgi:hypothetical protein
VTFANAQLFSKVMHNGNIFPIPGIIPNLEVQQGINIKGSTNGYVLIGNVDGAISFHSLNIDGTHVIGTNDAPCSANSPLKSFQTNEIIGFEINGNFFSGYAKDIVQIDNGSGLLAVTGTLTEILTNQKDVFVMLIDVYGNIHYTVKLGAYDEIESPKSIVSNSTSATSSDIYIAGEVMKINGTIRFMAAKLHYDVSSPSILSLVWNKEYECSTASIVNPDIINETFNDLAYDPITDNIYLVGQGYNLISQVNQGLKMCIEGTTGNIVNSTFNTITQSNVDWIHKKILRAEISYNNISYDNFYYLGDKNYGNSSSNRELYLGCWPPNYNMISDVLSYNNQYPIEHYASSFTFIDNRFYAIAIDNNPCISCPATTFIMPFASIPEIRQIFTTYYPFYFSERLGNSNYIWEGVDITSSKDNGFNFLQTYSNILYPTTNYKSIEISKLHLDARRGDNCPETQYGQDIRLWEIENEYVQGYLTFTQNWNYASLCEWVDISHYTDLCQSPIDYNSIDTPWGYSIGTADLTTSEKQKNNLIYLRNEALSISPNPNEGNFEITIDIDNPSTVNLRIYNMKGFEIVSRTDYLKYGKNILPMKLNLSSGIYLLVVEIEGKLIRKKISVH